MIEIVNCDENDLGDLKITYLLHIYHRPWPTLVHSLQLTTLNLMTKSKIVHNVREIDRKDR